MNHYVIESPAGNGHTFRVYVATEDRAREIANAHPDRTYRPMTEEDRKRETRRTG